MKQKAHAWVALRALRLIDQSDAKKADQFVELMSYYLSDVWDGAWLPDTLIRDMSYGHIFKMDSDQRFIRNINTKNHRKLAYGDLMREMVGERLCLRDYLEGFEELEKPYWASEDSGHLPDRVIALNHSIIDMLKMGDFPLAFYLKKKRSKAFRSRDLSKQKVKDLSLSPNFSARQIALTFFIVSHYICDAHMPLHCDLRDMNATRRGEDGEEERRLPEGLHPGIEKLWEKSFPIKKKLTIHDYTPESIEKVTTQMPEGSLIEIDKENSPYGLTTHLPSKMPNEWDEMVRICRISYAMSRKWIPQTFSEIESLVGEKRCTKGKVFTPDEVTRITGEDEFRQVTNMIFHDAVESVARIWYRAWNIFTR